MDTNNYFILFGIPASFEIDKSKLYETYLLKLEITHPDTLMHSQNEDGNSFTAEINNAYKTLLDDTLRAEYLLKLRNIDISKDDSTYKASTELLISMLELRETLEELNDFEQLKLFAEQQVIAKQKILEDLQLLFNNKNLDRAVEKTYELKYISKLFSDIKTKKKILLDYSN